MVENSSVSAKAKTTTKMSLKKRIIRLGKSNILIHIPMTYFFRVKPGIRLYEKLLDVYGENTVLYVQHYPGTGDIYLASSLFRRFTELEGTVDCAVMTVIGNGGKCVAQMFGHERVVALSQKQTDSLVRLAMFAGYENVRIRVTHYHPIKMTTGILDRMCSFKGTDFLSMYLDTAFVGCTREDMDLPIQKPDYNAIDEIFQKNNLVPGKTVVLTPYANTTSLLGPEFWSKIAQGLSEQGYSVCTNSSSPSEPAISNTVPVCPAFKDMPAFLERAGNLIALRSGFCEIAMTANCKQIILYPKPNRFVFGVGDLYDFFSFSSMGIRDDFAEIICRVGKDYRGKKKTVKKILRCFSEMNGLNADTGNRGAD